MPRSDFNNVEEKTYDGFLNKTVGYIVTYGTLVHIDKTSKYIVFKYIYSVLKNIKYMSA